MSLADLLWGSWTPSIRIDVSDRQWLSVVRGPFHWEVEGRCDCDALDCSCELATADLGYLVELADGEGWRAYPRGYAVGGPTDFLDAVRLVYATWLQGAQQ
jgi:hypothetical protein